MTRPRPSAQAAAPVLRLTVPGVPVAKGRPRFANGHAYTPERTVDAEVRLGTAMRQEFAEPLDGPLMLTVEFWFARPKSWSKARRAEVIGNPHTGKPDLDNLVKTVKDAGNTILWHDDGQIFSVDAIKLYGLENSTTIEVRGI